MATGAELNGSHEHTVLGRCRRCSHCNGRAGDADQKGMLPLTYQWDLVSNQHELAKGGWAGQLLYVNRDKDVVVAYSGTNQTANPKMEPLPCRIIAKTFF